MDALIRVAATEDKKAAAFRLRYELYVEEQGLFHDEADHERRQLIDPYDASADIFLAEIDGRIVGTARLNRGTETTFSDESRRSYGMERFRGVVDERDMAVITRLLVRKENRGGEIAFRLLEKLYALAAEAGAELIMSNCEPHLVSTYWKLGSRPVGELYNHPTNGALVPIAVVTGDFEHLRRIGSPMLDALSRRTKPVSCLDEILDVVTTGVSVRSQQDYDTTVYRGEVVRYLLRDGEQLAGILGDLTREEAVLLLARSHILACRQGDAIIRKGHVSRTLYMLLEGALEVYDGDKKVARVDEPGAVVGEVAFFSSGPRMSDVVAAEGGARVLALNDRNLRRVIAEHGPVAAKLLYFVSRALSQKLLERAGAVGGSARASLSLAPTGSDRSPSGLQPGDVLSYSAGSTQTGPYGFRKLRQPAQPGEAPRGGLLTASIRRWPELAELLGERTPLFVNAYPAAVSSLASAITVDTYLSPRVLLRALQLGKVDEHPTLLLAQPLYLAEALLRYVAAGKPLPEPLLIWVGGYVMPGSLERMLEALLAAHAGRHLIIQCFGAAEVDGGCLMARERNAEGELVYYPRDDVVPELDGDRLLLTLLSGEGEPIVERFATGDRAHRSGDGWVIRNPDRLHPDVERELESWSDEDWKRRTGYLRRDGETLHVQLRKGEEPRRGAEIEFYDFARRFGFSWLDKPWWR